MAFTKLDLEEKLTAKRVYYETFYQLDEGHVPRPPAMKETLSKIQQWMTNIEETKNNL